MPVYQCIKFGEKDSEGRILYASTELSRKHESKCGPQGKEWHRKIE